MFCLFKKKIRISLIPAAIALICVSLDSCRPVALFEENKIIPDGKWSENNKVHFEMDVLDTVSLFNLFVNIRNTGNYKYSNLFLFVDVFQPEGKIERDTIECILADSRGKWLGSSGSGSIWDNQILFNRKARFPGVGKYVFRFTQAMREKELEGIMDVGLRIENH